jgi:hypothetical protein
VTPVIYALLISSWLFSSGQDKAIPPSSQVRSVPLTLTTNIDVKQVTEPYLSTPIACTPDGSAVVRVGNDTGLGNILSISRDGKQVVRFGEEKITDIQAPVPAKFFADDRDVYVLVAGRKPKNETLTFKRPDGQIERQQAVIIKDFIAHFRRDGTYVGAIALDLPFEPHQIGAFPNGDFLIAGAIDNTTRLALVKSNGQFQRFLELEGDIYVRKGENSKEDPGGLPQLAKQFDDTFFAAEQDSEIVADGQNLLLIRSGQQTPVYSVSPGGSVKSIKLNVPSGFSLWDLKTNGRTWFALYTHKISDSEGVEFSTYSIDPANGKMLAEYKYPKNLGFGLACVDDSEFSYLEREADGLQLVKLVPVK